MRLLAIDEGSNATGLAFFQSSDRPAWTRRASAPEGWAWRRRMRTIAMTIRAAIATQGLLEDPPDYVAIEGAVMGKYAKTAIAVAECRGYLLAHFDSLWPDVPILTIPPSLVRSAVGISAFAGRAHSKDRYRQVAQYLGLPAAVSEDEADACCVGLAAFALARARSWNELANAGGTRG